MGGFRLFAQPNQILSHHIMSVLNYNYPASYCAIYLLFYFIGMSGSTKKPYKPLMVICEEKCHNGTKHIHQQ